MRSTQESRAPWGNAAGKNRLYVDIGYNASLSSSSERYNQIRRLCRWCGILAKVAEKVLMDGEEENCRQILKSLLSADGPRNFRAMFRTADESESRSPAKEGYR